jgi:hypothetical protein
MEIEYPSRHFVDTFDRCIVEGAEFSVRLVGRRARLASRHVRAILRLERPYRNILREVIEKALLRELLMCLTNSIAEHEYQVTISDGRTILLKPKK